MAYFWACSVACPGVCSCALQAQYHLSNTAWSCLSHPHTFDHTGGRHGFDYTSWEGTRQLTATLLKADFGVAWWLAEGQLVPPVTNRANYVHWVQDLLLLSAPEGAAAGVCCVALTCYVLMLKVLHAGCVRLPRGE